LLSPDAEAKKILLSKVLSNPRLQDQPIPIDLGHDLPEVRMVPESKYLELQRDFQNAVHQNYQKGYEEGNRKGYAQGLAAGKNEARQIISQLETVVADVVRQKKSILINAEKELLNLVMLLTEKIVGGLAKVHQDLVLETIHRAVPILVEKSRLIIKVSPEQVEFVQQQLSRILEFDQDLKEIRIEADRRIAAGGGILETSSGRVDARLEKQLEVLFDALTRQIPSDEN